MFRQHLFSKSLLDAELNAEECTFYPQYLITILSYLHIWIHFSVNSRPTQLPSTGRELDLCDLCLVVGTSSVVYPAAMFAPQVAARGVPVAEFNIEATPATDNFG